MGPVTTTRTVMAATHLETHGWRTFALLGRFESQGLSSRSVAASTASRLDAVPNTCPAKARTKCELGMGDAPNINLE